MNSISDRSRNQQKSRSYLAKFQELGLVPKLAIGGLIIMAILFGVGSLSGRSGFGPGQSGPNPNEMKLAFEKAPENFSFGLGRVAYFESAGCQPVSPTIFKCAFYAEFGIVGSSENPELDGIIRGSSSRLRSGLFYKLQSGSWKFQSEG